jgi:ribonuclease P protein component
MTKGLAKGGTGTLPLVTLKRRAEFQRIRKGARWAGPAFVLEARRRSEPDGAMPSPHFGFTVTRQVGKAVERNRIRRRLKAAMRNLQKDHARPDFDYVLIARRFALEQAYAALVADLETALDRVNDDSRRTRRGGNRNRHEPEA